MRNQRGQAAIFVALMFNVLFIFFAMAINVALVVHDKINLQNSIDLAAYYAAMKEAEVLNVIAHENYMIRQSWKLLAWRYHLLGTMGLFRAPSPPHPVWTGEVTDTVYPPSVSPAVCVTYKPTWLEVPDGESLCNTENLRIPPLPKVQVIAGFLGINAGIAALSEQLRTQFDAQCEKHGAFNWWFAMSIMHAFQIDQRNRKQVIKGLATNLSTTLLDLDGNSIAEGARQTFYKNLTYANKASYDAGTGTFELYNGLNNVDMSKWLVEVDTIPTMLYTDVDNSEGCNASTQPVSNLPMRPQADALLLAPFPGGFDAADLELWKDSSFLTGSDYQYSIGYEKNPWYMVYVGVKASTNPRQIFFPIGSGVPMTARAYAKPFGGRIGPWYKSTWKQGDSMSSGTPTDGLMAPRMEANGTAPDGNDPHRLPNYSRYPGDTLGMSSKLALNSLSGLAQLGISFDYYKNIKSDMTTSGLNDILAWDGQNNQAPSVRNYEILAMAPDLFDVTYYSIEPDFGKNYFPRLVANANRFGIGSDVPIRPDLGFSPITKVYSVQDQFAAQATANLQKPEAYYFIRNKANVLTAWLPGPGAFNYDVAGALANFGKCALSDDGMKYSLPGSCAAGGGRTGYSVKLISRDALLSGQNKIGGPNVAPGAIQNPPTGNGW